MSTTPEEIKAGTAGGFGRAASTYDSVIPFFETFARHLVEAAAPRPGDRVLDVACGRGACLLVAAQHVGQSGAVLGVDLASAMIEGARQDLAGLDLPASVEVRVADAEHLDVPDDAFDLVVCGFGVFFFPDPAAAASEFRRVLRPGGRFAGSTFVGGGGGYPWIGDVVGAIRPGAAMPPPSPVATAAGLVECLQEAGFVDATTREVEARFVFPDLDAYVAWNWSTGTRRLLEALSNEEAEAYRRESAMRIEDHAVPGGYELVQRAALTVATKPRTTATLTTASSRRANHADLARRVSVTEQAEGMTGWVEHDAQLVLIAVLGLIGRDPRVPMSAPPDTRGRSRQSKRVRTRSAKSSARHDNSLAPMAHRVGP